jgi:outer membrane lipoprotein SlyB
MKLKAIFMTLLLTLGLAACTTPTTPGMGSATGGIDNSNVRSGLGTVESVERVDRANVGALGTIGGAVVGGLLGHQIGGGRGQTAATIAGAAGGAYAGREVERRSRGGEDVYKIYIRMDDGSYQAVAQESAPAIRQGDRVRIQNGVVSRI